MSATGHRMIPRIYLPPLQTPFYWMDEQSGDLPRAVKAYYAQTSENKPATPEQLQLLISYLQYVIDAPCWAGGNPQDPREPQRDFDFQAARTNLEALRRGAQTLDSVESVRHWISACIEEGIDPL